MYYVASFGAVAPELAVAMATGNTAKLHNLNRGIIRVGAEADLAVVDAQMVSQANDALGALAIGDTMAVAGLVIDGEVKFSKSRNTPPATRTISCSV
jgi:enamidase